MKKHWLPVILIVALTLISYGNKVTNEFVWDDHIFILENTDIKKLENIPGFFSEDVDGLYRPLRTTYYTVFYALFGEHVFWYHLQGIVMHGLISLVIYFLLLTLFKNQLIALFSSLIFVVHPIHTGRVTNITASFDLLGVLLMLLAWYAYVIFDTSRKKGWLLASLVMFAGAVFYSEEAITLPLLIVLYHVVFQRETFSLRSLAKKQGVIIASFFVIAAFYLFVRFILLDITGRVDEPLAGSFLLTMATMITIVVRYLYLLLFPITLQLFHNVEAATSLFQTNVMLSLLFIIFLVFLAYRFRKNQYVVLSAGFFAITLIPFSNILPLQVFMAERYLYLPSLGFSLLLGYGIFQLLKAKKETIKITKVSIMIAFVVLLGLFVVRDIQRNLEWKDNLTLWTSTVQLSPESSRAHDNLGFTYERMGETQKALEEFETAIILEPTNFRAWANLGVVYAKLGRYNGSINALRQSLILREYHKTYDKLGLIYAELQREDLAIQAFENAISLEPRYAKAYNDLGTVWGTIGRFEEAEEAFLTAIEIDPSYEDAQGNLRVLREFLASNS